MNNNSSLLLKLMLTALFMITAIANTTVKAEKHVYTEGSQRKELLQRYSIILGTWTSDLGEGYSQNLMIDKNNVTERITDPYGQIIECETKSSPYAFEWDDVSNELFIKTLIAKYRIDEKGIYAKKDGMWKPFKKTSNTSTSPKPSKPSKPKGGNHPTTQKHPIGMSDRLAHHLDGYMIINKSKKNKIKLDFICDHGTISDITYYYPAGHGGRGSSFKMQCTHFDNSSITFYAIDDDGNDFYLFLNYNTSHNSFNGKAKVITPKKTHELKVELKATCSHDKNNTSYSYKSVHPIGADTRLSHHLEGFTIHTNGPYDGKKNAITLDFTCDRGVISNAVFRFPEKNGKINMKCINFDSSKIVFYGVDHEKNDFYINLYYDSNSRDFNGTATVGINELNVVLKATCSHF